MAKKAVDLTEAITQEVQSNPDAFLSDDIELDHAGAGAQAAKFIQPAAGLPSKAKMLQEAGMDEGTLQTMLQGDSRALEFISQDPVIAAPVAYDDSTVSDMRARATISATLESSRALGVLEPGVKEQLRNIAAANSFLPTQDIVTYRSHRKIHISNEVRDVPNKLSKKLSMEALTALTDETTVAKVILTAQQFGVTFFEKPALWLAQRLAWELSNRELRKTLLSDTTQPYDPSLDTAEDSVIRNAVASLFSTTVLEMMEDLCQGKCNLLYALPILINYTCDKAADEKRPQTYIQKYDDQNALTELLSKTKNANA